jgi:hypothetical protein
MSFETVADTTAEPLTSIFVGGFCIREMEIVGVTGNSLARELPTNPQPAIEMEITSKNSTDRYTVLRRALDPGLFPECNEKPLPAGPDSPQNDEPNSLQRPRLIIRNCPLRNSKRLNIKRKGKRRLKPTLTNP